MVPDLAGDPCVIVYPDLVYPVDVFLRAAWIAFQRSRPSGLKISSWKRSPQRTLELLEQGRGVPRSLHEKGLAWDVVGPPAELRRFGQAYAALGLDAVFEADHLHIEFDGPALRRLGLDFRS